MKTLKTKLIALALLALGAVQAQATVVLSESFDDVRTLAGSGWQVFNDSTPGGSTTWFQGNTGVFGPNEGTGYVAANFLAAPAGGFISLYLIAPELLLSDGDTISFWTRTESDSQWADVLGVGIKDSIILPWLVVNPNADFGGYPDVWTQYTAVISGLGATPTAVRFSFLYYGNADDLNYIGIDSLEVDHRVPEPGTLMLLGLGLAGLGFVRRRNGA
jgi:hypothetical protein